MSADAQKQEPEQTGEKSPGEIMHEGIGALFDDTTPARNETEVDLSQVSDEESKIQEAARQMGWTPKDEFRGDPVKYVDADEFIRRQELFDKIHTEVSARKKLEKQLESVAKYVKTLTESEYSRKLADLKAHRKMAMEDSNDVDTIDKLNDEIVALERIKEKEFETIEDGGDGEKIKAQNQELLGNWVTKNAWFNSDQELRSVADDYAELFSKKYPEKTLNELLNFVDEKMKRHIKAAVDEDETAEEAAQQEFVQPKQKDSRPMSQVAEGRMTARRPASKSKVTRTNLDPAQLDVLTKWILPNKIMTEQEYIQSLIDIGEIK